MLLKIKKFFENLVDNCTTHSVCSAHARVYDQQSHDILDLNMIFEISISNYIKDAATIDDRFRADPKSHVRDLISTSDVRTRIARSQK